MILVSFQLVHSLATTSHGLFFLAHNFLSFYSFLYAHNYHCTLGCNRIQQKPHRRPAWDNSTVSATSISLKFSFSQGSRTWTKCTQVLDNNVSSPHYLLAQFPTVSYSHLKFQKHRLSGSHLSAFWFSEIPSESQPTQV